MKGWPFGQNQSGNVQNEKNENNQEPGPSKKKKNKNDLTKTANFSQPFYLSGNFIHAWSLECNPMPMSRGVTAVRVGTYNLKMEFR